MKKRSLLLYTLFMAVSCCSAQTSTLIVSKNIRLQFDSVSKNQLLNALDSFVIQKEKPVGENSFVAAEYILETAALLDEMKNIESSRLYKDKNFFKCYLTNALRINDSLTAIQLSYLGANENIPVIRASFKFTALQKGNQFYFYAPLKENTATWKSIKKDNIIFHFRENINQTAAGRYQKMVRSYDARIGMPKQTIEVYACNNFLEALQLLGVEYKADYNGNSFNTLSSWYNNRSLYVLGTKMIDNFNHFDPHDLWHDRLHVSISPELINRPVDEGCAYLYGGSWGIGWPEILMKFKKYAGDNPNADWLSLYNSSLNFDKEGKFPLNVDHVINALLVEQIESTKGFAPVIELLRCGKYEPSNNNYFTSLQKITGIGKNDFNAAIWSLIKNH